MTALHVFACEFTFNTSAGHQFLYENGILHRDVSAGNILLASEDNPEDGAEGFITDVEFAHLADGEIHAVTDDASPAKELVPRGAVMTVSLIKLSPEGPHLIQYFRAQCSSWP